MAQLYTYQGQEYSLPDGLSNEEAMAKIKKHLGVDDDRAGYIASAGAGVVSGVGKAAEGITTLGTTLIDLGAGTELTDKVEKAFDDNDFLNKMEDVADDRWTGKVTEILTQLGVPGGIALKGANVLIKAKNLGTLSKTAARMPTLTRMAAVGGAELAAKTEDLGTLGDMMGFGLTEQRESQGEKGRREALRNLENRFKFGLEGASGFGLFEKGIIPFIKFAWQKAIPTAKGIITRSTGGPDRVTRMVDETKLEDFVDPVSGLTKKRSVKTGRKIPQVLQLDDGFQFSSNNILRYFDNKILAPLRARGVQTPKMFDAYRKRIGEQREALTTANDLVRQLENDVQDLVQPLGGALDDVGIKKREEIMESIYDYLTAPKNLKDATKIPQELLETVNKVRSHVDNLSETLMKNPLAQAHNEPFIQAVASNIGEYLTRSYRALGSVDVKKDWRNTLYNTDKGRDIIEQAKIFIAEKNPGLYGDVVGTGKNKTFVPFSGPQREAMDAEITLILDSGKMKTLGGTLERLKSVDGEIFKARQQVPKEIRALLGEIKDPSIQLLETSNRINNFLTSSKYFNKVFDDGYGRYFFDDATVSQGGQKFTREIVTDTWNPLNGKFTSDEIATAIERMSDVNKKTGMFDSPLYNGLLLAPKAIIQESKTTLSPITHFRNVASALHFSGMNGNLFNPATFIKDFKKSFGITKAITKGQFETQAGRRLYKDTVGTKNYEDALNQYKEMQRLGIVNTSARLGDLTRLLDDMSSGLENLTSDGQFYNILKRFNERTGLKRLREGARSLYSAEDDFYKIQNWFAEQSKYKRVWDNLRQNNPEEFVAKYGDLARDKYGITNLLDEKNYNQFVKEYAANTVRNNIPNYDYVGSFIQGLRKAPFGNFVSFPAEILRTGINTINQGAKEFADPLTRGIGFQRLLGAGLFGVGSGKIVQETAQFMSGVSNETINSLREFLPDWSQNSTLIPIKQNGQIYYIDYSHSNAYDFLTRPLTAAMNGINKGITDEKGLIGAVSQGAVQAGKEFLQPFFSESIITEFYLDVFARGGETKEGVRIWNPSDDVGDKVGKTIMELAKRAAPGSFNQIYRTYLSGVGNVQKYDRGYKFLNEATGLLGFRIQNPFIQQGLQFKITDNQDDTKNAKSVFEKVARDGNATPVEIAKAYAEANERKKEADKILYKKIKAAENLGLSKAEIRKTLNPRFSKTIINRIMNNRTNPLKVSDFVRKIMRQNSLLRNRENPLPLFNRLSSEIYKNFRQGNLFDNPDGLFDKPLEIDIREEDRTPNIIYPTTQDAYGANLSALPTMVQPNIPTNTGNVINQSDVSQLAKSGDIDITEAIAARRT